MKLKGRGYTYILAIITTTILLIGLSLLIRNFHRNTMLYKNQDKLIQSKCYSESIINEVVSSNSFKDRCSEIFLSSSEGKNISTNFSAKDLEIKSLNVKRDDSAYKEGYLLALESHYKGVRINSKAIGTLVDEIYTKGISVINKNTASTEELDKLRESYSKEYGNAGVKTINLGNDNYFIRQVNNYFEFYREEIVMGEFGVEEIRESIDFKEPANLSIIIKQKAGSLTFVNEVTINGIVDVENIFLNRKCNVNGILLLNSEINQLNGSINMQVSGITINIDGVSENNLFATYNFSNIEKLFRIIPDFINPKLKSIKIGDLEI